MQKIWFWLIILLVITGFGLWFWYSKMMPSTKQPSASSDEITYIALGDSYTIGNGVQTEERWPNVLTAHLKSSGQNIRLIANPAVSGYKVSDALEKELPIVEQMKPDFVTVLIGANDNFGGKAPAFFQEELQEFLDQLQKTMKNPQQIVLITIPDYSKSPSASGYDTTGVTKSIQEYMVSPYFVLSAMNIDEVLQRLQRKKLHMAVVTNEHGEVVGLVTLEDVLEEIVGDIADETDEGNKGITRLTDDNFLVTGELSILDFNRYFKTLLPQDATHTTVSGFILEKLGRFPDSGDVIKFNNLEAS